MALAVRPVVVGLALGATATILSALVARVPLAVAIESRSYDLRVKHEAEPAGTASPVVIVEINDSSVRALEPIVGRWPWPRMVHASAIDFLKRAGAKVVAYDVLFTEREGRSQSVINGQTISGSDSDRAFVSSVQRAGNVILLADALFQGLAVPSGNDQASPTLGLPGLVFQPGAGFQPRPFVTLPFEDLASAAAGVGHNYLAKDEYSDSARRMLPFIDHRGVAVPSLGTAAALKFLGSQPDQVRLEGVDALSVGTTRVPLLADPVRPQDGPPVPSRQVLLRFRQPVTDKNGARATFPTYSFFDVVLSEDNLLSGRDPVIPTSAFAGKIVFIGTTAAGLFDRYSSPFEGGAAGVELHATLADNIVSGSFMRRSPAGVDVAYTLVSGLAAGLAAALLPIAAATITTLAMLTGLFFWLAREVGLGVWVSAVMPACSAGLALFGGVTWRYFVEDRAKRHVRKLFGRYVSHDVIEQLMADPSRLNLGGQRRDMTVLFSDIRGFTSASEKATPEAVVAQLNEYFGAMVEVLFRHQGTLDKFVGDMVMGLFGAPLADDHHADHALAAALDMSTTLDQLNEKWRSEGKPELNIGIGINSGEMIAGNIGSEAIMSYTVIGDAVNLGSRLESLNKEYGTRILISEETRSRLTMPINLTPLGAVNVKGRVKPVEIFSVTDMKGVKNMKGDA